MTAPNSIPAIQSRGRTFFICALLLSAIIVCESTVSSLVSGRNLSDSSFISIIYTLVFYVALRSGFFSLQISKGRFGIIAEIIVFVIVLIPIGISFGKPPAPNIRLDSDTFRDFLDIITLLFISWALIFSKSVKEFVIYQIKYFQTLEMRKIQENIGRTGSSS